MTPKHPFAVAVVALVADAYGLDHDKLWTESRYPTIAEARALAWWKVKQELGWSSVEIGLCMGVHHTTVLHALRKIGGQIRDGTCTVSLRRALEHLDRLSTGREQPQDALGVGRGLAVSGLSTQPRAPAPSLSLDSGSGSQSSDPALSSGSKPESKRARAPKPRLRNVPESWQPNDAHRELALQLGVNFEQQLTLFRDHEFKDPKSNFDAAFRTWLRRAHEYSGSQRKTLNVPPGLEEHNVHKQAAGARIGQRVWGAR